MRISETFLSFQGEGATVGKLSYFIRLSGCNLRCNFCDSKYTWGDGEEKSISNLKDEIKIHGHRNIIITGGEPLLQQKELFSLIFSLKKYKFEIETNGTIMPMFISTRNVFYNISPKLKNSGNDEEKSINSEALRFFSMYKKSIFKFVITSEKDLDEVLKIINRFDIPREKIYLMPEGVTSEALKEKTLWLVEVAKQCRFNFSPRMQIEIWGSKRGV